MDADAPLTGLKGIGEKTNIVFGKAGIRNIGDLLSYYPRTYRKYEDISDTGHAKGGETIAVYAKLSRAPTVQYIKRFQIVSTVITDQAGSLSVRWYNMPYLKNSLKVGASYVFCGRVVKKGTRLILEQPALFSIEQYQALLQELQPVYALTKGLTNQMLTKAVRQALDAVSLSKDYLCEEIREKYQLAEYDYALEEIHFPKNEHHLALARRRLVFDEFFLFILALRRLKEQHEEAPNHFDFSKSEKTLRAAENLGYRLTGAQRKVWREIQSDMTGKTVMARLIQGDVGSGKTILAFLAMLLSAENGLQSCIMAPTEVLARQHYASLNAFLEKQKLPYQAALLTGSMTASEKRKTYARIKEGSVLFIVGTHALIQEKAVYQKLGLVVTDEQHRFGVRQRELLGEKGEEPHTIVMSATPIPRTLAVILYGDLSISVIDEMPAGRKPVKNCVVGISYRKKAYEFIEREVRAGHQAYIICPMVEESEQIEAEDVLSYAKRLRGIFPADIQVDYLHGKMKSKEKTDIMERFLENKIQVLVSTTVVEVGVNVPNATVMMIENAERFGLAQLHQLRGRVGRGDAQSYCILMTASDSKQTKKRLDILSKSNDGFYIAREDLKLRGPGDILGVRQSGMVEFKIGDVFSDANILQEASEAATWILQNDSLLQQEKHRFLKEKLKNYMSNELKKINL